MALAAGALLLAVVEIQSAGNCPDAAAIARRIGDLVASDRAGFRPDRATIRADRGQLTLTLERADGKGRDERSLATGASCTDLVEPAAVIIATWETELHPDIVLRTPQVGAAPPHGSSSSWELAAGISGSYAGGETALGGTLWARAPLRAGLGARLALAGSDTRTEALGMGSASWTRFSVALGLSYRVGERWHLDAEADAVLGLLSVSGQGFDMSHRELDVDPGFGLGARVGRSFGALDLWLATQGLAWVREQQLEVTGLAGGAVIPRLELLVSSGFSMRIGR